MFLTKVGFNKSEECATEILEQYKLTKAPIPIEDIIIKQGLNIIPYDLGEDISGILFVNELGGTIGVNPKDNYMRQRFSMAHELGHYLLHREKSELFVDKDFIIKYRHTNRNYSLAEKKQEQEANAFAAAILMPNHFIEKELESEELQGMDEAELISILAAKFKVSEVAMSYRFTNLNNYF